MAREAYDAEAETVLLDDPLSAVDAYVGQVRSSRILSSSEINGVNMTVGRVDIFTLTPLQRFSLTSASVASWRTACVSS